MEISFFAGLAAREPEGKRAIPVTSKKRLCRFFDALNIAIVFVDYSYKNILSILIPLFLFDEEERRHRQCQQLRPPMASQMPSIPSTSGRNTTIMDWNKNVLAKEIVAETKPLFNAVKKAELNILKPPIKNDKANNRNP